MYYNRVRLEVLQLVLHMDLRFVMELVHVCGPLPALAFRQGSKANEIRYLIRMTLNTGTCSAIRTFLKINQEKHSKPALTKLVGSKNTQHFPPKLPSTIVEPTSSKDTTLSGPDSTYLTLFNE